MKKFYIVSDSINFCGPSEDEIKAQVDLAVETALSDATSTTTTLAPTNFLQLLQLLQQNLKALLLQVKIAIVKLGQTDFIKLT